MNAPIQPAHELPLLPRAAPVVKLSVMGSGEPQAIPLRRPVAIIGSRPGCKVQLAHAAVNSLHALIVNTGSRIFVRDLLSDSGTFLNDLRVDHELLDDGDVIRVGPWEFRISIATASAHDLDDFTGINLEPAPAGVGLQRLDNHELLKLPKEVSLIGRKNGCDVLLPDRRVSRIHVVAFEYFSHPAIADLLSENGIVVRGIPQRFSVLEAGDEVEIGPYKFATRTALSMPKLKPDQRT